MGFDVSTIGMRMMDQTVISTDDEIYKAALFAARAVGREGLPEALEALGISLGDLRSIRNSRVAV